MTSSASNPANLAGMAAVSSVPGVPGLSNEELDLRPIFWMAETSRVVVVFVLLHTVIIFTMVMVTQKGLAAPTAEYHNWVRFSLLAALAGNIALLCRNWRIARRQPASPLVPRRVRNHLMLLRAARAILFMALCLSIPLALYFLFLHAPYHSRRAAYATLISAVIGPLVLAFKFRWLTVWQRRLHRKATAAQIPF